MSRSNTFLMFTQRSFLAASVAAVLSVAGTTIAHHSDKSEVEVTELSQRDIIEKLNGHDSGVTVVEVTFQPGQEDSPHKHAGPVFGYVLEGEYEHAIDDEPVKNYKAGETFYEPSGCIHRVARNPSERNKTRLLAVILHPRDVHKVTLPANGDDY